MNEISNLVKTYNRLWQNVDVMHQDIRNILEDFDMKYLANGKSVPDIAYSTYIKEEMVIYIIIDLSAEIPFLQVFKYILNTKDDITKDYLKEHGYCKWWDPNDDFNKESITKTEINKGFISIKKAEEYERISSPKIDILSIDSTDTVNLEIKELLSNMKDGNYEIPLLKEIKIIE